MCLPLLSCRNSLEILAPIPSISCSLEGCFAISKNVLLTLLTAISMTFQKSSLVVIDPAVQDYQHLIKGVHPQCEIVVLDPVQDGIAQISQLLSHRRNLESIHIVSHGQPGKLLLGSAQLSLQTLAHYAATIQSWAKSLKQQASILLYGCQVAAQQQGQTLVQQLHALTGATVAASVNLTGSAASGGDWLLEFVAGANEDEIGKHGLGKIASGGAFQSQILETYPHVLAVLVSETFRQADVEEKPWIFGTGTAGSANPFLTARTDPNPSVNGLPGSSSPIDTAGNGALRLTNNSTDQAAFVIYNNSIASNAGLSITFDFFAYNGTGTGGARPGGDGISFFLIDGAQSPTAAGAFGGSLGYAQKVVDNIPGIVGGYLGVGLDEFGNFSNPADFTGGPAQRQGGPGEVQDSIAIRGSGSGLTGYPFIAGSGTLSPGIDNVAATNRADATRKARIDITPTGVLSVKVDLNNDGDFADTGEAPTQTSNIDIISANGGSIPSTFKFGFASSTGNATNIHEVRNLTISTFSTPPTVVDTTVAVSPNSIVNVTGLSGIDAETSVASYTIVTLPDPTQGTLFLGNPLTGGTAITAGQTLTADQLPQLYLQSQPGFTGGSFTYRATDTDGDTTQTPGTVTLGLSANQAPTASDTTVNVTPGSSTNITGLPATDSDGSIASYTVVTLPPAAQGTLFFGNPAVGGTPVTVGQVISPANIGQLFFQPTNNFTGSSFTFTATDNIGTVDATPATVTLNRINNTPPVLEGGSTISVDPDSPTNLTGLTGTDSDGSVSAYVISTIPAADQGTLFVGNPDQGGTPVTVGQRLTSQQIDRLFFRPATGFNNTSFTYAAIDNQGATSNPRTITLSRLVTSSGTCAPGENLKGSNARNQLVGGTGSDRQRGLNGNDNLRGKQCNDRLDGGRGNDRLFGNDDNDVLLGRQNNDRLDGGKGIDVANGGLGRDRIRGRLGEDTLFGRRGNDTLNGNGGDDSVNGNFGRDKVRGGNGDDALQGGQSNDRVDGGKGNDLLGGGLQQDRLLGRSGADVLLARRGNDRLRGGSQADDLSGELGRDVLIGGGDADTLSGGGGRDRFVYRNAAHGLDTIVDFESQDQIVVRAIFAKGNYSRSSRFDNYVRLRQTGSDTIVQIDANGNSARGFVNLVTLLNVNSADLASSNFLV